MAQTKKKRRSKHRGNAAGVIEARGRTGRKPTVEERKASGRELAAERRRERMMRPPSWKSAATRAALAAHSKPKIYLLGPPETISERVERALGRLGTVTRVGSGDAVRSSIDFARFVDGDFGWGVVDPGHGLVFARADRPLDAAAAALLSASGTYGPLILLSNADRLDAPTTEYLLDIQPGYRTDPVRGVYNHGWIVGDDTSISVGVQAKIDSLLEITRENRRAPSGSQS
jgi:hypothetical protein